jgi:hypothetical protein
MIIDLSLHHGLVAILDTLYQDGEWAIHDLKEGEARTTYWNAPP